MDLNPMIEDMLDSDEAFRAQFDRANPQFHGGDPTPVAVGGSRVPASMPTEVDPNAAPEDTPTDPEYHRIQEARTALLEFKKALSLIPKSIEAQLRAKQFKDPAKREAEVAERTQALAQTVEQVWQQKESLRVYADVLTNYEPEISELIRAGAADFPGKKEYGDYMFLVSKFSQKLFKEAQKLLQQLKDIKRR